MRTFVCLGACLFFLYFIYACLPGGGESISPMNDDKDTDEDGLTDSFEIINNTNPNNPDTDLDGILDYEELIKGEDGYITDPTKPDTDDDGFNDKIEIDYNHDPTDPYDSPAYEEIDTDKDGLYDKYEELYGLDPNDPSDAQKDADEDGLSNLDENSYKTNPLNEDTDEDGLEDGEEVSSGLDGFITNPLNKDTDEDGLTDGEEVNLYNSNPLESDTDLDGLSDKVEVENGLNPTDSTDAKDDNDNDGLNNKEEILIYETDIYNSDTDSDGIPDGAEVHIGTSPKNSDSDGDKISDNEEFTGENGYKTDPTKADTDNDQINDYEEIYDNNDFTDPLVFNGLYATVYYPYTIYPTLEKLVQVAHEPDRKIFTEGYVANGLNFYSNGIYPPISLDVPKKDVEVPTIYFILKYTAFLYIPEEYNSESILFSFTQIPDDICVVLIDGKEVGGISYNGEGAYTSWSINITPGIHSLEVIYFQYTSKMSLDLQVSFTGEPNQLGKLSNQFLKAVKPSEF